MTIQTAKLLPSVAAWGLLQLAILGIGAGGFPLWAHHPLPRESLGFQEMLCGQTLLIAMLFPVLTGSVWAVVLNLLLVVPFDELSGLLSVMTQATIFEGFACVALWMIGLAGWRRMLKSENQQLVGSMTALLFTAGGVLMDYLHWEKSLAEDQGASFRAISLLARLCSPAGLSSPATWALAGSPLILFVVVGIPSTLIARMRMLRKKA